MHRNMHNKIHSVISPLFRIKNADTETGWNVQILRSVWIISAEIRYLLSEQKKFQNKSKNIDEVYQSVFFRCIMFLSYRVTFLCNVLGQIHYTSESPVRYFFYEKVVKWCCYYVNDYLTAAQDGKADFIVDTDPALEEALNGMDNFTAYSIDSLFYKYLIFNMKGTDGKENEAMQNVEVRKALIEAIDRATLATLYPNASVLNSGVPNDNDAYNGFEYTFDADKAKADLEASGYDMGRTLKICYYNNDQTSVDLINTIVYYIEQTGLKVEATLSSDGTTDLFTTRDYDIGFKGKGAFSINEWYTEYMSTDGLFSNIFGGDTDFDEPIAKLTTATSAEETKTALENLETLEQEKVYKIPLFTVGTYAFVSDKVTLPEGVEFCNPLYMNDIDFTDWEMNE